MTEISTIINLAKEEAFRQQGRLESIRQQIDAEQFKTLFTIRASQAMVSRKNLTDFVIDDNNREVINMFFRYIKRIDKVLNPHIGIVLNGAYGCGKSVLIEAFCMVLNDITLSERNKIQVVHAIELAETIKKAGVIPYSRIPLCIQDMGKETKDVNNFGTSLNPISELLAVRAEYGSLTYGSTNMDIPSFQQAYKEYISKRITEHINLVFLPGGDRRPNFSINQPKK